MIGIQIVLALVIAMFSSVVSSPSATVQAQDCPEYPTLGQDLITALSYGDDVFEVDDWDITLNYIELERMITVTWRRTGYSPVAQTQYLFYDCGYDDLDLETYLDFEVIFSTYESYEQAMVCESDNVRLYHFDLIYEGEPYLMRMWLDKISDTRVALSSITFPARQIKELEKYAQLMYPELSYCEPE